MRPIGYKDRLIDLNMCVNLYKYPIRVISVAVIMAEMNDA